jgi:hypothetical protein
MINEISLDAETCYRVAERRACTSMAGWDAIVGLAMHRMPSPHPRTYSDNIAMTRQEVNTNFFFLC